MNLESIKSKSDKLAADMEKTGIRRQYWHEKTKELIYNTLTTVQNQTSLSWWVQKVNDIKNQEFVNIQLHSRPSGISVTEQTGEHVRWKAYVIEPGYLTFTQSVNGKIYSIISYPYVEGIISRKEILTLGLFEPEELTEELVLSHVETFVEEMIKWQNNYSYAPIGFKIGTQR